MRCQHVVLFVALAGLMPFCWACKHATEPVRTNALARIDLELDFRNDSVKVELDSQTIFSGRVTTNYALSAAWESDHLDVAEDSHTVKLTVFTDNVSNQMTTYIKDTVVVAARYDRQARKIDFRTYSFWFLRD